MSKPNQINEGGIIGTGAGLVNQNSEAFKELQKAIQARSQTLTEQEKVVNRLLSVRFQII